MHGPWEAAPAMHRPLPSYPPSAPARGPGYVTLTTRLPLRRREWRVVVQRGAAEHNLRGLHLPAERVLVVFAEQSPRLREVALLHEALHVIFPAALLQPKHGAGHLAEDELRRGTTEEHVVEPLAFEVHRLLGCPHMRRALREVRAARPPRRLRVA